jgi:hypothetical protein
MVAPPKGPAERGSQSQHQLDGHTPRAGITQSIQITPGPPRVEQYAPATLVRVLPPTPFPRIHIQPFLLRLHLQEVPNDRPHSQFPLPHNTARPSRGNPSFVHSGMSVGEDLKNLASYYLHDLGSHVEKLRMKRSRSGAVKVLILLEVDDVM